LAIEWWYLHCPDQMFEKVRVFSTFALLTEGMER